MLKRSKNSLKTSSGTKVVIVDLDETLIDTPRIKKELARWVKESRLNPEEVSELASAFSPFNYERYIALRRSPSSKVKQIYKRYTQLFAVPKEFNFLGAEEMLRSLKKRHLIYMVTYGCASIQTKKIRQTGFRRLLNKIIVTGDRSKKNELEDLANKFPGAYVLDDEPYVCDTALRLGLRPIKIRKGKKGENYYKRLTAKLINEI